MGDTRVRLIVEHQAVIDDTHTDQCSRRCPAYLEVGTPGNAVRCTVFDIYLNRAPYKRGRYRCPECLDAQRAAEAGMED